MAHSPGKAGRQGLINKDVGSFASGSYLPARNSRDQSSFVDFADQNNNGIENRLESDSFGGTNFARVSRMGISSKYDGSRASSSMGKDTYAHRVKFSENVQQEKMGALQVFLQSKSDEN